MVQGPSEIQAVEAIKKSMIKQKSKTVILTLLASWVMPNTLTLQEFTWTSFSDAQDNELGMYTQNIEWIPLTSK